MKKDYTQTFWVTFIFGAALLLTGGWIYGIMIMCISLWYLMHNKELDQSREDYKTSLKSELDRFVKSRTYDKYAFTEIYQTFHFWDKAHLDRVRETTDKSVPFIADTQYKDVHVVEYLLRIDRENTLEGLRYNNADYDHIIKAIEIGKGKDGNTIYENSMRVFTVKK